MIELDAAARFSCVIWASVLASVLNFMLSLERLSELALDAKTLWTNSEARQI